MKPSIRAGKPSSNQPKSLPFITRLQRENASLKEQLAAHEARMNFVPGFTNIDWTHADMQWLSNVFNQEPGKKLRCLLNNIERHYSFWALRELDMNKKEDYKSKAIGMSLVLNYLHYWANHGRAVEGVDKVESDMLVRGPGEITPDELEKRLSEMSQRPRMGSSRMMSL